ncbi:MAG: hypothetical protein WB952_21120 [Terriglobales bacterium]
MNEQNDDKIVELLKQSIGPVDCEPQRDLWPHLLDRLQERAAPVPWFDWALLAALALWLCFAPGGIPVLLYHL